MKTVTLATSAAWLLSSTAAQQFVMYTAGGDDTSVERADPILASGKISQHVHQVFGSDAFAPEVSYESLQNAGCTTVGDASGNGNGADLSIYWHPALFMEASDGSGYIRVPTNGHKLYYKNAGTGTPREPFEFPHGFRMLAGNPFMRAAAPDVQQQNITQWICHSSGGSNQGTDGGFPTGVTNCDAYPGFNGAIHFPHCWNGKDFNPADPAAHISYPTGDIENGECSSSHPIRLPHIFIENQFNLDSVSSKVKPDSFVLAMGDNTGYGWHADFYNGWKDGALPDLFNSCPQGEYGNEDIGSCPTFEKSSTSNNDCKLKTFYQEKVDAPGQNLPGCNPIIDTNPAPYFETAPLGTYSTNCKAVGGGSGGPPAGSSSAAASAPPASSSGASSASHSAAPPASSSSASGGSSSAGPMGSSSAAASASSSSAPSSSTLTTSYKASSKPAKPTQHPHGSKISCPESNHQTYKVHGKTFKLQCGIDHSGGDMKSTTAHSLAECVAACAKTDTCVDVSLRGTACYLKDSLGSRNRDSGVIGAKVVDSGTAGTVTTMGDVVTHTDLHRTVVTEMVTVTAGHHRHAARHAHAAHARWGSL